ncbi:BamA/TamA family outer membrane protein [Aquimarina agarivorans]|uniref:BamA/TamA family outer membrane protein n=1 Tax=Aquimarina agarivorans TaxID=980584 RepID=UPI000248E977|nr:BamA/TamA family outer membrane protein [Aquimarina agarivorans]
MIKLKTRLHIKKGFFLLFFLVQTSTQVFSQDFERIKEFFTFYPNKKKAEQDSTLYKSKFIVAPIVSFSPETSLAFGAGAKYLFKFQGSGKETRTSNMPVSLRYTLNNQFILFSGFEMFTNQEKWVIEGNALVKNFPQLFYGIGRDTPESNEEQFDFVQALIEPIFLKQTVKYLFVGAGFRYNHIFDAGFERGKLLDSTRPSGYNGSTSAGAEVAVLYDSRNNILNADNGWYLEFTHGFYGKALGGTHEFELTRFDIRHFLSVSKKTRDVLAFQVLGHFSSGDVPLLELAQFGSGEILRGYREGRYLDRHLLAGQVEYRKSFKNSRWGAVAFLGTGDVTNSIEGFKIGNLRPNFGVGLRFLLDREENLNVRFDWGFGKDTNNVYLNLSEAF